MIGCALMSRGVKLTVLFAVLGFAIYVAEWQLTGFESSHYSHANRSIDTIFFWINPAGILAYVVSAGGTLSIRGDTLLGMIFALANAVIYAVLGAVVGVLLDAVDAWQGR